MELFLLTLTNAGGESPEEHEPSLAPCGVFQTSAETTSSNRYHPRFPSTLIPAEDPQSFPLGTTSIPPGPGLPKKGVEISSTPRVGCTGKPLTFRKILDKCGPGSLAPI